MAYSLSQISKIKSKLFAKISAELDLANENDEIEEFLEKYGIVFEEDAIPVDTRTMKILVFGALAGKEKDYKMVVKKSGIEPEHVVFIQDYSELKRYNVAKLENSFDYSDIIFGPVPHKQIGIGDNSSFLAMIKKEPHKYPRVIEAVAEEKLKITITGLKRALLKTRYFEAICN